MLLVSVECPVAWEADDPNSLVIFPFSAALGIYNLISNMLALGLMDNYVLAYSASLCNTLSYNYLPHISVYCNAKVMKFGVMYGYMLCFMDRWMDVR